MSREQTKRLMDGWLPVVLLDAQDGPVRYEFMFWATPLPSVSDWQKAFGWPSEGENFLNWIAVRVVNTGDAVCEGKLRIEQTGSYEASRHPVPSLAPPKEFSWLVEPQKPIDCAVAIPWEPVEGADYSHEASDVWLDRTLHYWQNIMANAASIRVPCEKASQAYLAAHVCQLIASDHGELHGGEGFYDHSTSATAAHYQVMELEEAGLWYVARNAIEPFSETRPTRDGSSSERSTRREWARHFVALWQVLTGFTSGSVLARPGIPQNAEGRGMDNAGQAERPGGLAFCGPAPRRASRWRVPLGWEASYPRVRFLEPSRASLYGGSGPDTGQDRLSGPVDEGSR